MPSILHNPPSHLRYNAIPVTQCSLIYIIGFLTWGVSLTPPSSASLSYALDPTSFTLQRFRDFLRVFDPFRERDYLASFCVCSFYDADRGKLQSFGIGVPGEGCEAGSRAVRVKSFNKRIRS